MSESLSICRLCHNLCSVIMTVEDGLVVKVTGDRENPGSLGYTCVKGRAIPEIYAPGTRLLTSLVRRDGDLVPIGSEEAMDVIADRIRAVVARHGPRSVAIYTGTMAFIGSEPTAPVMDAFAESLGTPMRFTPLTIDMPGKAIAYAMHGVWMAPHPGLTTADVGLLVGVNPMVSHVIGPLGHPGKWMGGAIERGIQLVVIDPRRSETAKRAAIHLQPRPGHDVALLSAMLKIIVDEGLHDREFIEDHTSGFDALVDALATVDPATVAAHADVELADLTHAARLFAGASDACSLVGTGANMAQSGTLLEYLALVMQSVCGHWPRAGDPVTNPGTLRMEMPAYAQARPPMPAYDLGEPLAGTGLRASIAGQPTAALPDDILSDRDDRVRVLISVGGNPVAAWPDRDRTVEALRRLDLLVQVDPFRSQTASIADVVVAPTLAHERPSTSQFVADLTSGGGFGRTIAYGQYVEPVLNPPPDSDVIDEWELFHGLAQRLGLELSIGPMVNYATPVPGVAQTTITGRPKPTTAELIEILCTGSRIPLDEVRRHPHGAAFPDPPLVVQPRQHGWGGRLDLANPDLMTDLMALHEAIGAESAGSERPFRLLTRRMMHVYNSSCNTDRTNRGRVHNPLFVHPDDLATLGISAGDTVEIRSDVGATRAVVEDDRSMRRGCVALSHAFGPDPDVPGPGGSGGSRADADARSPATAVGSAVASLVGLGLGHDRYSGQPRMSGVPVDLTPVRTV